MLIKNRPFTEARWVLQKYNNTMVMKLVKERAVVRNTEQS